MRVSMTKRKTTSVSEEQLYTLETRLAGALRPLQAPRDIIQRLRARIHLPDRTEIASRLRDWSRLMLVLGGVMSGLLVLITIARALFHLVGRRHPIS